MKTGRVISCNLKKTYFVERFLSTSMTMALYQAELVTLRASEKEYFAAQKSPFPNSTLHTPDLSRSDSWAFFSTSSLFSWKSVLFRLPIWYNSLNQLWNFQIWDIFTLFQHPHYSYITYSGVQLVIEFTHLKYKYLLPIWRPQFLPTVYAAGFY